MNLLAIVGSYRRGKTIDTLVDSAIDAARAAGGEIEVNKVHLIDRNIEYCRNCRAC